MPVTRNRVIYAGTNVFISDYPCWSGQTGYDLKLLKRVQSSAISISNPVTRARQVGSVDFAFEKYIQQPQISVNLDYLLSDNSNELLVGLNATGEDGALKFLRDAQRDRNLFFVLTDEDGSDADDLSSMVGNDIFAIGNCFLTNYSASAQVGGIPSASVSFDCLNMTFQTYSENSQVPAINLTNGIKSTETYFITGSSSDTSNYLTNQASRPYALRPGDIVMQLEQPIMGGIRYSGPVPASINSFEVNIPMERKDLLGFGSNYPYDKRIIFPLVGTISFNGIFDEPVTGDFSNIFTDENEYDFVFNLKNCDGATGIRYEIQKARVESQSFDISVDNYMSFQSQFSFKIFDTDGFRISGAARIQESGFATIYDVWTGSASLSGAYDDFESYSTGANLNALDGGWTLVDQNWTWNGAWIYKDQYVPDIYGYDSFDSYSTSSSLDTQNGGTDWSGAWVVN